MDLLPRSYVRDVQRLDDLGAELQSLRQGNPHFLQKGKKLCRELEQFLARWQDKPSVASQAAALGVFRQQQEGLSAAIERLYVVTVRELLSVRSDWMIGELLVNTSVSFAEIMKHAPASLRPSLEQIHRQYMSKEFAAEEDFRDAVAGADEHEAKFRALRQELARDWPERLSDPIIQRIDTVTPQTFEALQQDLNAREAALVPHDEAESRDT